MKEKDLLKNIKREAERKMPNLQSFVKTNFANPNGFNFFKWIPAATILTGIFIFSIIISNASPIQTSSGDINSTPSSSLPPSSEVVLPPLRLNSDKEAISISSVTSATLLSNMMFNEPLPAIYPTLSKPKNDREKINFDDTMMLLKPYLSVFEQLLGSASTPIVTSKNSDNPNFDYLDTFNVYDIELELISYDLYFNITDSEIIGEETYYDFVGELIVGGDRTYLVEGSKTLVGLETSIHFKATIDAFNSIETEYTFEDLQTLIVIRKMINGLQSVSAFKLELDSDETVVELLIFDDNDTTRTRDSFKFEYEIEDGETILEIRFNMTGTNGRIRGKIQVSVVPILNQNNDIIGFQYQAIQFNEDGEIEDGEWQDDRHGPNDNHDEEDDEVEDADDETNENDEDEGN